MEFGESETILVHIRHGRRQSVAECEHLWRKTADRV